MTARARKIIANVLSYATLAVACFVALFPLFWTVSTAIKQRGDTFVLPPKFFSFEPTAKNFSAILQTRGFWQICLNCATMSPGPTSWPSLSRATCPAR